MTIVGYTTTRKRRSLASRFGVMIPGSGKTIVSCCTQGTPEVADSSDRLDITTNNPATQVYTAYWLDTPRKKVHGGPSLNYTSYSAVAIEQEGYIDAINTPEWNVDQICTCSWFYPHGFTLKSLIDTT